jgi:hypothetical protein
MCYKSVLPYLCFVVVGIMSACPHMVAWYLHSVGYGCTMTEVGRIVTGSDSQAVSAVRHGRGFAFWLWRLRQTWAFNALAGWNEWGAVGRGLASSKAEIRLRGAGPSSEAKIGSRGATPSIEVEIGSRGRWTLERAGDWARGQEPSMDGPDRLLGRSRPWALCALSLVNSWGF